MNTKRKKLICYGDSNTFGYDPRGWLGMRYAREVRWTTIAARILKDRFQVVEEGLNGRTLADALRDADHISKMLEGLGKGDVFALMLGTNDILLTDHPDEAKAAERLSCFLDFAAGVLRQKAAEERFTVLILAPPHLSESIDGAGLYHEKSVQMNLAFRKAVEERQKEMDCFRFLDAGTWEIPMSFDGVHFSEEGHRKFAERLAEAL